MTALRLRTRPAEHATGRQALQGDSTDEPAWLRWHGLRALPQLPLETWLPPHATLVVVAPHPGDEVLGCGGLLALHTARGGPCQFIAVSDGEASHEGVPPWTAEALGATRRRESASGLRALGVSEADVERLSLPDGQIMARAPVLAAVLAERLHGLRPDTLVISTWAFDGHPDHEACGRVTQQAARDAGLRFAAAPVWMWHWARPAEARIPWERLHALPLNEAAMGCKLRALAAHQTQLTDLCLGEGPVLGETSLARARRPAEHFFI